MQVSSQEVISIPLTPQYLSIPEVAERWSCEHKLVYAEVAAGRLKAIRIGKKLLRVAVSELERYEREYQTSKEVA
jgi:excisionase family DNA binding protein